MGRKNLVDALDFGREYVRAVNLNRPETVNSFSTIFAVIDTSYLQSEAQTQAISISGLIQSAIDDGLLDPSGGSTAEIIGSGEPYPSGMETGSTLWVRTDEGQYYEYVNDGGSWYPQTITSANITASGDALTTRLLTEFGLFQPGEIRNQDNLNRVFAKAIPVPFASGEPEYVYKGRFWYDTDNSELYLFDGNDWIELVGSGQFVSKVGGDTMQGALTITGGREVDASGVQSSINVLNVENRLNSDLQLRHNGNAKVYIGGDTTSHQNKLKLNNAEIRFVQNNTQFIHHDTDTPIINLTDSDATYFGSVVSSGNLVTKDYVDRRIFQDPSDITSNYFVKRVGDEMSGDLSMDSNKVINLGTAVDDADAISLGQVRTELDAFRTQIIGDTAIGKFILDNINSVYTPDQGDFISKIAGRNTGESNPIFVDEFRFNAIGSDSNPVGFDWEIGDHITLTQASNSTLRATFRVQAVPVETVGTTTFYTVSVAHLESNTTFSQGVEYNLTRTKFNGVDSDVLDDTYLRLDCSNDPLDSQLDITTPDFGEAYLKLTGKRDNSNNSAATIEFQNTLDSSNAGYITYRSYGSNQFFRFNRDVELNGSALKTIGNLSLNGGAAIQIGTTNRVTFKSSAPNGDAGNGLVQFERPNTNSRRGLTIRGKNTSNADTDILWVYTNSSGGDAINYIGRQSDDSNNLATTKYVKTYVANNVTPASTNLGNNTSDTSVTITSSTGDNTTIAAAAAGTSGKAGVMTKADKQNLDNINCKISYSNGVFFISRR